MQAEQEALKTLRLTLAKYRANKEKVSPKDLETKYKKAFASLKQQLKEETETYLTIIMLQNMRILDDNTHETLDALLSDMNLHQIGKRAGRAVFKNYNLDELRQIGLEQRERNKKIILHWEGLVDAE